MMMMTRKLLKVVGRSRKLHTIISRETIKPSSSTPNHLQTYNISLNDQSNHHAYIPAIFFYQNQSTTSNYNKSHHLKKSLSQTLNQYYPFAGRLPTSNPAYIDCNDDGVVFLESHNSSTMDDIVRDVEQDKEVRAQLFPDCLEWHNTDNNLNPLAVQFNHFACGGTAVAVSMSHKIADACTLSTFMCHWANVTRSMSSFDQEKILPINPHFISSQRSKIKVPLGHLYHSNGERVVKRFIFSNLKISDLKNKVISMAERNGTPLENPTRVQVLTSLLHKTAVAANMTRYSGNPGPYFLFTVADIRRKMVEKLPETTVGNILSFSCIVTRDPSERELNVTVEKMKKWRKELESVENIQQAYEKFRNLESEMGHQDLEFISERSYSVSSLCSFPFKKVDFGWGKPVFASILMGSMNRNTFVLMERFDGDGIDAQVNLEKEDMEVFENDDELLAFCDGGGSNYDSLMYAVSNS